MFLLHTDTETIYLEIISIINIILGTIFNIIIICIIATDFGKPVYYLLLIYLLIMSTFLICSYLEGKFNNIKLCSSSL